MEFKVIDLYNEEINNWNAIKYDESIFGVVVHYEKDNKKSLEYISQCKRLKIPFGVSIKCTATNLDEAEKQAVFVKDLIKDYKLELPIYFNIIGCTDVDPLLLKNIILVFFKTLEANKKYYVALYIDMDTYRYLPYGLSSYDKWISIKKDSIFESRYGMIAMNRKTYPWANEYIKTNTCFINYPEVIIANGLNGFSSSLPFLKSAKNR